MIFKARMQTNWLRLLSVAVAVMFFAIHAHGQASLPPVDPEIANALITTRVEPMYPLIAKAAGVGGAVILQFTVTAAGDVGDIEVQVGPVMLQQAAIDAVKRWKYRPYLVNGKPTAFKTIAMLEFDPTPPPPVDTNDPHAFDEPKTNDPNTAGQAVPAFLQESEEEKLEGENSRNLTQCQVLWESHDPARDIPASVEACRKLVEFLDQNPDFRGPVDRIAAHDNYGLALLDFAHQPKEALAQFEAEVVLLPRKFAPLDQEYIVGIWHRGRAYAELRENALAEQDLSTAENSSVLGEKENPSAAQGYKGLRKQIIASHVQLLEQEGKHIEAQRLRATQKP
jgi:TonB family protein